MPDHNSHMQTIQESCKDCGSPFFVEDDASCYEESLSLAL